MEDLVLGAVIIFILGVVIIFIMMLRNNMGDRLEAFLASCFVVIVLLFFMFFPVFTFLNGSEFLSCVGMVMLFILVYKVIEETV